MSSLKEIKTRIASVKNTLKITSAMKMVASAKLHKAQTAIGNKLPYEQKLHRILAGLLQSDDLRQALAKELGPSGICVNCIAPGVIDTEMNGHLSEEDIAALCDETPLGRVGKPSDIAHAALFFAEADFVTGETLSVGGGFGM